MGSQPQAFAKPVGGGAGMGLLPQPSPLHRGPKAFSAKQPAREGRAGLGAPSMSVQEQLHPDLPGCSCPQPGRNLQRQQRSRSPAQLLACNPTPDTPWGSYGLGARRGGEHHKNRANSHITYTKAQLQIFPKKLKRRLMVHPHTNLIFLWALAEMFKASQLTKKLF